MQLETIWLCRDLEVLDDEWTLIRVTRRFPERIQSICLCALISGKAAGDYVPFNIDVFGISHLGANSLLDEPIQYELAIGAGPAQLLAVQVVLSQPLIAGGYYASLSIAGFSEVVSFEVGGKHAS